MLFVVCLICTPKKYALPSCLGRSRGYPLTPTSEYRERPTSGFASICTSGFLGKPTRGYQKEPMNEWLSSLVRPFGEG